MKTTDLLAVGDAKRLIRGAGLRCTASRIALLQCLSSQPAPLPASDISAHLQPYGFDKSTIYRALSELSEAGLLTRLDLGDAVRRYEMTDNAPGAPAAHPHFICAVCGAVQCLDGYRVVVTSDGNRASFDGVIDEILVRGRCSRCREEDAE